MPVFSSISFAVIGDQQYAVLRIRSSLVQTISPLYTARASTRGMTANRSRTSIAGYGVTGAFAGDRKSTRLNSSHGYISYAVFCLKKKKKRNTHHSRSAREN